MKTAAQNPAIHKFGHLLLPNGRYPAKWVDIFSSRGKGGKITDVEVVFIPREQVRSADEPEKFWENYRSYNARWNGDLGNSCHDWLKPDGMSPATVFGSLLSCGFASDDVLLTALREFAHIEECDWAREMLGPFERD